MTNNISKFLFVGSIGGGGKQAEKITVVSSGSNTEPDLDEKELGILPNSGWERASDNSSEEEKIHNALVRKKQKLQVNKVLLEIAHGHSCSIAHCQ